MFPGMRGMNPRQMEAMMRKMGITTETVKATEVIVMKPDGKVVIKNPNVSIMTVQGERTWQITGTEVFEGKDGKVKGGTKATKEKEKPKDKPKGPEPEPEELYEDQKPTGPAYAEEDVNLVIEQTGCSEEQARKALKESDGQPAEAILRIMSKR